MSKKILECQYCKSIITEKDTTCPKCGANCSDVIKAYRKEMEEEEKKKQEEMKEASKKVINAVSTGYKINYIIFVVAFVIILGIIVAMAFSMFSIGKGSKKTVTGSLDEEIKGPEYTLKIDNFETYEYYDDFFKNCNTKEGYQRVAFHFVIENTTDKTISTSNVVYHIDLKAEDEVVNQSDLDAEQHFCNVVQGKAQYNKLPTTNLLAGDKVSGYLGFEVPKNKETLKFIVDESIIVEMANPVYEASEEE